jgi:predicted Fe-Mo cluster-binding NifX family protein
MNGLSETTWIGFQEHHANSKGQAIARSLKNENADALIVGNLAIFIEIV